MSESEDEPWDEDRLTQIETLLEELDAKTDAIEENVSELEVEFQGKIEDVRERVIQLKREIDEKADDDRIDEIQNELDGYDNTGNTEQFNDMEQDVGSLTDRISAIEEDIAELDEKTLKVAHFSLELEEEIGKIKANIPDGYERTRIDELLETAHEKKIYRGKCQDCSANIELGLLQSPNCPQCDTPLTGIKSRRLFKNVILTDDTKP
jgi:predicted  nucleic acid-binding Zn-ribbon protein